MRLSILVLFLFFTQIVGSQTINISYFYDSHEIESIVDSLRSTKVNQIMIVQTERLRICKDNWNSISTTLIWPADSGYCNIMTLCSNLIFLPFKAKLDHQVLDEKAIKRLMVKKDEDIYKFVPPFTNANAIFFYIKQSTRIF